MIMMILHNHRRDDYDYDIPEDGILHNHRRDYEECRPLGCHTVCFDYKPTFRRKMSPPAYGQKKKRRRLKVLEITSGRTAF
jgi:hypothetical protein